MIYENDLVSVYRLPQNGTIEEISEKVASYAAPSAQRAGRFLKERKVAERRRIIESRHAANLQKPRVGQAKDITHPQGGLGLTIIAPTLIICSCCSRNITYHFELVRPLVRA